MTRHLIVRTTTQEFQFDPKAIEESFEKSLDLWDGDFNDFVIHMFEEHDGSVFGDKVFSDTTNYNVGLEVVERGDDE